MSWNSAPNRSACPRVSSLASGSSSTARRSSADAPNHGCGLARELDRLREHRARVAVDVEVVVRALLDARATAPAPAARPPSRRAESITASPSSDPIGDHDPPELGEHPLGRDVGEPRGSRGCRASRRRLGLEPELGRQPRHSDRPQRVCRERIRARPSRAAARRDPGSRRTGRLGAPPPSGSAIALIVRSRWLRSASIESPTSGSRSTCQLRSWATTRQPPNVSDSENGCPPAARASAARGLPGIAGAARRRGRRSRDRGAGRAPHRRRARPGRRRSHGSASSGALTRAHRRGDTRAAPALRSRTGPRS